MIERHAATRGRTTPEITWRVWNPDHTCYVQFKTKKEATDYLAATEATAALADYADFMDQVILSK